MSRMSSVVSAKMGELGASFQVLSGCATDASVRDESDALKVLLAGVETRFREEHTALIVAINAHTAAMKAQTSLLEALCGEVKTMNERIDILCSHTGRLGNIEGDVAAIAKSVHGVANGTDTVTSFVSSLNEHLDDIQPVFCHKINEAGKVEEGRGRRSREGT